MAILRQGRSITPRRQGSARTAPSPPTSSARRRRDGKNPAPGPPNRTPTGPGSRRRPGRHQRLRAARPASRLRCSSAAARSPTAGWTPLRHITAHRAKASVRRAGRRLGRLAGAQRPAPAVPLPGETVHRKGTWRSVARPATAGDSRQPMPPATAAAGRPGEPAAPRGGRDRIPVQSTPSRINLQYTRRTSLFAQPPRRGVAARTAGATSHPLTLKTCSSHPFDVWF